jgi:hypothetical protein
MTEIQLTTALNSAMKRHLMHDLSSTIVEIGDSVRRLVTDEDHAAGTEEPVVARATPSTP